MCGVSRYGWPRPRTRRTAGHRPGSRSGWGAGRGRRRHPGSLARPGRSLADGDRKTDMRHVRNGHLEALVQESEGCAIPRGVGDRVVRPRYRVRGVSAAGAPSVISMARARAGLSSPGPGPGVLGHVILLRLPDPPPATKSRTRLSLRSLRAPKSGQSPPGCSYRMSIRTKFAGLRLARALSSARAASVRHAGRSW